MAFTNIAPKWNAEGAEPPAELLEQGFTAGYKPPAAYFNYLFNQYTKAIDETQEKVEKFPSLEEINNILSNKMDEENPTFSGIAVNGNSNEVDNLTGMVIGDGNNIYCDVFDLYTFTDLPSVSRLDQEQTLFMVSTSNVTVTDDYAYISVVSTSNTVDDYLTNCDALAGKEVALVVNNKVYFTKLLGESIYYVTGFGTYVFTVVTKVQKTQEMRDNITSNSSVMIYYYSQHTTETEFKNAIKNTYVYGSNNKISGEDAYILGSNNRSYGNQLVTGHYNNVENATVGVSSGTSTGTAFCIGNGTLSAGANAFRVNYQGSAYGLKAYNSSGADFAEFREWLDGNPDNEDRVGYFVTREGLKIKKANAGEYVAGVTSGNPCLVGNSDECWRGKYVLDNFDRFIEETFEYEETIKDEETGEEIQVTKTGTRNKVNPNYDPNQKYIERAARKEWAYVCMRGEIAVYDDGTCEVDGYCKVADGGIATAAEVTDYSYLTPIYRVVDRVTENIVKIEY